MPSWKTPTPETLEKALALLAHAQQHHYFFDKLENPRWLRPLRERGYFSHPPAALHDPEQKTIQFVQWPESRYLARMAAHAEYQEEILSIALALPDTDNQVVREDIVDVALNLSAPLSARLVPRFIAWTPSPYGMLFPKKLGELISHLSRGGELTAALEMARAVLAVVPDQRYEADEKLRDVLSPEPRPVIEAWSYGEILRKHGPDLISATGLSGLRLLCDLLEKAVKLSRRSEDAEPPQDYSEIWRPAVEQEDFDHRVAEMLVSAVRDAAVQISRSAPPLLPDVLEALESRLWLIFTRVALHLLREANDAPMELVAKRVADDRLFEEFSREYALLVQAVGSRLPTDARDLMLGWIERGPDLERFKTAQERWIGSRPTEEEAQKWGRRWQLERLAPLRDALPGRWQSRYRDLVEELGEPKDPGWVETSQTWVGPTSPKSAQDLAGMTIQDLIAYLQGWRPSGAPTDSAPEGLGRLLSSVVESDPERFALAAEQFEGLDPTYVRSLLHGLSQAAQNKRSFPWQQILVVAHWILQQPREVPGRAEGHGDIDPGWTWSRSALARLLSMGLQEGPATIPAGHRSQVWDLLRQLSDDPEPTPEYEGRYGGTNMDPATLSINTTRGEAMHAVVRYALWVRATLEKEPESEHRLARGFQEMPEVREVLERHLDTTQDPSLAIRSVYGQRFPWLALLDPAWAQAHVTKIFPLDADEKARRMAAWQPYIIFCQPYNQTLEILRAVYARAIDELGTGGETRLVADPERRLAEHLMILQRWGRISVDEVGGLLPRFFDRASDELRAHALSFVGRGLREWPLEIAPVVIDRLKTLWQSRLAAARAATDRTGYRRELAAFGLWFASGKFEDEWAVAQLLEVLELVRSASPDHAIADRLTKTVAKMPTESVRILDALVKADTKGWSFPGWDDDARAVLKAARESGNEAARAAAGSLIHFLGSRGYWGFRELL